MKSAFHMMFGDARPVLAAALLLNTTTAFAQMPLNEQTLDSLRSKPSVDIEKFADDWVASTGDQRTVATALAAIIADKPALIDHANLIRTIGKRVEPEFTQSVLAKIEVTADPLARGGLLQLLRGAPPNTAASIEKWLSDTRPGEDLVEQSKRAPKLREAIANGAVAFRVCDIVFNVMEELRATNDPGAIRLTRSQSIEARDGHIRRARGTTPDATPDEVKHQPLPSIMPPPTQLPKHPSEAKPTTSTPSGEPASSMPWSIIVVLIVAAIGLLWLLLKGRK
jgi:hypothetical protein